MLNPEFSWKRRLMVPRSHGWNLLTGEGFIEQARNEKLLRCERTWCWEALQLHWTIQFCSFYWKDMKTLARMQELKPTVLPPLFISIGHGCLQNVGAVFLVFDNMRYLVYSLRSSRWTLAEAWHPCGDAVMSFTEVVRTENEIESKTAAVGVLQKKYD